MNPNAIYVRGRGKPRSVPGRCLRCGYKHPKTGQAYLRHARACLAKLIATWDEVEYSKRYFKQVRALSRFRQPGDPRRPGGRKSSWGWWLVKPDGPVLTQAERASSGYVFVKSGPIAGCRVQ